MRGGRGERVVELVQEPVAGMTPGPRTRPPAGPRRPCRRCHAARRGRRRTRARAPRARRARRSGTPGRSRSGATRSCRAAACPAAAARSPPAPGDSRAPGCAGAAQRQPAVTAQAAIPARPGRVLARENPILRPQLGGVGADEPVAADSRRSRAPSAGADASAGAAGCLGRLGGTHLAEPVPLLRSARSAILSAHADLGRSRRVDGHRGRAGGRAASGADIPRSRTARSAMASATTGPGRREAAARDVAEGRARAGDRVLLDGYRRVDRREQGRRRARGPLRRRRRPPTARGAGTTPTCSRSACARPPRPSSRRSSTRGSRPSPAPDAGDQANVEHLGEIERGRPLITRRRSARRRPSPPRRRAPSASSRSTWPSTSESVR